MAKTPTDAAPCAYAFGNGATCGYLKAEHHMRHTYTPPSGERMKGERITLPLSPVTCAYCRLRIIAKEVYEKRHAYVQGLRNSRKE